MERRGEEKSDLKAKPAAFETTPRACAMALAVPDGQPRPVLPAVVGMDD